MKSKVFFDGPQRTMSQAEYEKKMEEPCFFCGEDNALVFYIEDIKKIVCFNCVGSKEVEQFEKMVKNNAKKKR